MSVTVTYQTPVAGITAPTAAQAFRNSILNATVAKSADGDTTATITHNWGLTAAELAAGFPIVTILPLLTQAALSAPIVSAVATNSITITTTTATGSGTASPQFQVCVQRPNSSIK